MADDWDVDHQSWRYALGTTVVLRATEDPDSGHVWSHWSGDLPEDNYSGQIEVVMDANKSITAHFVPNETHYTLTVDKIGNGRLKVRTSFSEWELQPLPYTRICPAGQGIWLDAVPEEDWIFGIWQGPVGCHLPTTSPNCVSMDGDRNVTAWFETHLRLALSKNGNGSIKVNGQLADLPCLFPNITWSQPADDYLLEATPDSGWKFTSWSRSTGSILSTSPSITIPMDSDYSDYDITANFIEVGAGYTLTIDKLGNGTVKVNGVPYPLPYVGTFPTEDMVSVELVADAGWWPAGWAGPVSLTPTNIGNYVNLYTDMHITACFGATYNLTISGSGSGSVKRNGSVISLPWSMVDFWTSPEDDDQFEAVPSPGWKFTNWSLSTGDILSTSISITIPMEPSCPDYDLTANFEPIQ